MKNQFTYDIKENKFYLDGEPIVLTTDDVLWATDVHASGISPFGGIQENTVWKQYSTLTDTMRQLIEKAVLWTPYVTFSVSDTKTKRAYHNQFPDYIEYDRQYEYIVTVIYHDGMYLQNQSKNQPAYCKCNSLNLNIFTEISSGSTNPLIKIDEYVDKSDHLISKKNFMEKYKLLSPYDEVKKFKVIFYPNKEDESFDTYKVNLTFSYEKSEKLPVIKGASDEYIKSVCIGESNNIITKEFNDIKVSRPIIILTKFDSENVLIDEIENITTHDKDVPLTELNDLPENSILLKELNECPIRLFDLENKFNFVNSVGDNIFIFAIPVYRIENSIRWYNSPLSDEYDDTIDYSDLLTSKVIKFENIKYYLYAKSFCDPMLNSNSYTIEIN